MAVLSLAGSILRAAVHCYDSCSSEISLLSYSAGKPAETGSGNPSESASVKRKNAADAPGTQQYAS